MAREHYHVPKVIARVNDPRSAQQISAVVILPVMALILGQFTGLLVLSPVSALATALVLALVAVAATWIAPASSSGRLS